MLRDEDAWDEVRAVDGDGSWWTVVRDWDAHARARYARRAAATERGYGAAIAACEKGQWWHCELRLLAEIRSAGVAADVVTYGATLTAARRASSGSAGHGCWRRCAPPVSRRTW